MPARQLAAFREQLVEVSTPAGRVLAGAEALCLCRVQHTFDPTPQAHGGFMFGLPYWAEHPEHVVGADLLQGPITQSRGVRCQRGDPLAFVLLIPKPVRQVFDEFVRKSTERRRRLPSSFSRASRIDWIATACQHAASFERTFSRLN